MGEIARKSSGQIVTGVLLLVLGPVIGLVVAGALGVGSALSLASDSHLVPDGGTVEVRPGTRYVVHVPADRDVTCAVETPAGAAVPAEAPGEQRTNVRQEPYVGVVAFVPETSSVVVGCDGLGDREAMVSPPVLSASTFAPAIASLVAGMLLAVAGIVVLVRKPRPVPSG